jgi:hypothetical protein
VQIDVPLILVRVAAKEQRDRSRLAARLLVSVGGDESFKQNAIGPRHRNAERHRFPVSIAELRAESLPCLITTIAVTFHR